MSTSSRASGPGLAVVTGASSGIGEEFARQLAARGYNLLLTARREQRLQALADVLRTKYGIGVGAMPLDLSKDSDVAILAECISGSKDLALLVNNAGFGTEGLFHVASLHENLDMHKVHVLATLTLSHAALENFERAPRAGTGIINVSSVASFFASPSNVSYSASKAWITRFSEGLAAELAGRSSPIRVQALCPGFTYSEFHDRIKMSRDPIPKQLWMTAEFVVAESLRGFDEGKLIVIPGWRYKALTMLIRLTPGALLRKIAAGLARRYRKPKV